MRFSTFHVGQMDSHLSVTDVIQNTVEDAVLAESLGFDTVWVAEHHFSGYGVFGRPTIVLGAIASQTSRIRLGTGVTVLPFSHPVRLAEELALLDQISKGRAIAGVGPGFAPVEFNGFNLPLEDRRDRFFEALHVMVRAWTEDTFTHTGRFVSVKNIEVFPKPYQKPYPLLAHAATKAESQIFAAKHGRPILLGRTGDEGVYVGISRYIQTRQDERHPEKDILDSLEYCGVLRHIVVSDDGAKARREALAAAHRYVSLANKMVSSLDFLEAEDPEDLLERGAIVGTPDEVMGEIDHLSQLGVRHLICWFDWGGLPRSVVQESMQAMAERVMPNYYGSGVGV